MTPKLKTERKAWLWVAKYIGSSERWEFICPTIEFRLTALRTIKRSMLKKVKADLAKSEARFHDLPLLFPYWDQKGRARYCRRQADKLKKEGK
jgi:hypothetical protein